MKIRHNDVLIQRLDEGRFAVTVNGVVRYVGSEAECGRRAAILTPKGDRAAQAGCAFLIFLGWLTAEQRHGLDGIILWCFFYGLPAAVLIRWFQPYVTAIAARLPGRERRRQPAVLAAIVRQRVEARRLSG